MEKNNEKKTAKKIQKKSPTTIQTQILFLC